MAQYVGVPPNKTKQNTKVPTLHSVNPRRFEPGIASEHQGVWSLNKTKIETIVKEIFEIFPLTCQKQQGINMATWKHPKVQFWGSCDIFEGTTVRDVFKRIHSGVTPDNA